MSKGFLAATKDGTLLTLRASPGAKRTSIEGLYGQGALKLRVAAPPVDGKANAEVERFLARDKVVLVRGLDQRETHNALLTHLS